MSDKTLQEKYIEEFIYGAIDGIITTFAIVASVIGAGLSPAIVLILGFANLLADGFSMGSSSYLSSIGARDLKKKRGEEAEKVHPMKNGLATFLSFISVGGVSLVPFLIAILVPSFADKAFLWSIVLTAIAFVVVGIVKAKVTHTDTFKSALSILLMGTIASVIAFGVGYLLQGLV
jgi:VIT1/CCC1 family predicted Fe2+/Mn2+ transporter